MKFLAIASFCVIVILACEQPDPNINQEGSDELRSLEVGTSMSLGNLPYQANYYVPIYSDIYVDAVRQEELLSATLSIRNTSESDSIFVSRIDYYNTEGDLVRKYLDATIGLGPMGTINYVIEKEDDTGGSGANFYLSLSGTESSLKPVIQAVMVGETGNKGFAFVTNGIEITK